MHVFSAQNECIMRRRRGTVYLVYPENGMEIQNGDGKSIRNKAFWNLYEIGTMMQCDDIGRERVCYPNSIAQYKDTPFVIAVDGTDSASMFEIIC